MRLPLSVFVFPVNFIQGQWHFLLLKRVPVKKFNQNAFWQGVTGGVESGETFLQAARRECEEETSLNIDKLIDVDRVYHYKILPAWQHRYPDHISTITERVFVAVVANMESPILSEEHSDYYWCTYKKAIKLLFFDENKKNLLHCKKYLEKMRFDIS